MNRTKWVGLAAATLAVLLPACGDEAEGPGPTPGQQGKCTGPVVECYKFKGPSSCIYHTGCSYNSVHEDCNGNQVDCDEASSKADCLYQVNCTWTNPDGTTEAQPRKVVCTGKAPPCSDYKDKDTCHPQFACKWSIMLDACVGRKDPSRFCFDYNVDGLSGFHPKVAIDYCNQLPGCKGTLYDKDGKPVKP